MSLNSVSTAEYSGIVNVRLNFAARQERACHHVSIVDDDICELDTNKNFSSGLEYGGGEQPIIVNPALTEIIIDDTNQPECGE